MQVATAIYLLCILTHSASLALEDENSSELCVTVSDSATNCTQGGGEVPAFNNTAISFCKMIMLQSETAPIICQILENILNTPGVWTDIGDSSESENNSSTLPSYTTEEQNTEDLGINETPIEDGQNVATNCNSTRDMTNSNNTEENVPNVPVLNGTEIDNHLIYNLTGPVESNTTFWHKLFHWPSFKNTSESSRRKRDDIQYPTDSENFSNPENDEENLDKIDGQNLNNTEGSGDFENCDNEDMAENSLWALSYDVEITEIRNEIIIVESEVLDSDVGETTTAAPMNTNTFIDRSESMVPKNINKRDVNTTESNMENVNETKEIDTSMNVPPTVNNNELLLLMNMSLLGINDEEIGLMFPSNPDNTTAQPQFITFYVMNGTLEVPSNTTLTKETTNSTSL